MPDLNVNVDHVATLRQARLGTYPDPLEAAIEAEKAGVSGITAHLREDRRHMQDDDIRRLRKAVKTRLNLEMAAVDEIIEIALETAPDWATLVPEKEGNSPRRAESTSNPRESGLRKQRGPSEKKASRSVCS